MKNATQGKTIGIATTLFFAFIVLTAAFILGIYVSKILATISVELKNYAAKVDTASSGIASSSRELSVETTKQASSLQETSSSIEEISAMLNST